ncbi:glycosyltransferase family 2 protein [Patescibacteria group bacterium]|nr:glycosyltransferase family 2 protein [Patescibacteria group bacterium]
MTKLSVTLATFNEEKFLPRCLDSVKDIADEIVIADGKSLDRTVEIAKKYKAKVISTTNKPNFHINKRMANDAATGEWILQLDADEVVSPALKKEIADTLESIPEENGFWIPRANFFLGRFLKKGGTYPDYTMRLYRRGKGNLPAKSVHEQAVVEGKTGYLKNDLLHYNNPTFGVYLDRRFNRYSDIMAKEVNGGWFQYLFWRPLFDPLQGFVIVYFRHLGFLDGFPGFVWALFQALLFPVAYFKSIEKKI